MTCLGSGTSTDSQPATRVMSSAAVLPPVLKPRSPSITLVLSLLLLIHRPTPGVHSRGGIVSPRHSRLRPLAAQEAQHGRCPPAPAALPVDQVSAGEQPGRHQ